MTADDWDDAPAASEPTQPVTDRTPVVPTPAQADEWGDVSFVADFPDEVSQDPDYQPLQSPDTWDENDTALAAGYQQLAQDPEWNDIDAQRRAARALDSSREREPVAPATPVEDTPVIPVANVWEIPVPPAPASSAPVEPVAVPVTVPVPVTPQPEGTPVSTPGVGTVPGAAIPPVAEPLPPLFPPTSPVAVIPTVPTAAPAPEMTTPVLPPVLPPVQVPVPTDTAPDVIPAIAPPVILTSAAIPIPGVPASMVEEADEWGDAPTASAPVPAFASSPVDDEWSDAPVAGTGVPAQPVRDLDDIADGLRQAAGLAMPSITANRPRGEDHVPAAGAPVIAMGLPLLPEDTPAPDALPDLDVDPEEDDPEATGHVLVPQTKKTTPEAAASTGKGKKKTRNGNTIGGIRLTARDMKILGFLARYRVATVGQLARRFGTSETALRNRLPGLERAGLLSWAWAAQTKPKVWLITDAGLATVGMNLTVPTVRWGQLRHTLGLVDLGIAFELAGETVLTEREVRAAATRYTPTARMRTAIDFFRTVESIEDGIDPTVARVRTALTVPVPSRGGFGHIPDMVLARQPYPNGASGSIAVELELTRKGLSDWKMIVSAYRDSNVFSEVYYYVMSSDIKRGLEGVIKALGASQKIQVVAFTPIDLTADPGVTGGGA